MHVIHNIHNNLYTLREVRNPQGKGSRAMVARKYPFREMQIGDAFDVEFGAVEYPSLRTYVSAQARKIGIELSIRSIAEEGVWEVSRVEPRKDKLYCQRRPLVPRRTRAEMEREIDEIRRQLDAEKPPRG